MPQNIIYPNQDAFNLAMSGPTQKWRWPHFSYDELACPCASHCHGQYYHDPKFLDGLEAIRANIGGPIKINSAHRCGAHNRAVGGAANSWHLRAIAADIAATAKTKAHQYAAAKAAGFTGFGFGKSFLHVDRGPKRAWTYEGAIEGWIKALGHNPLA